MVRTADMAIKTGGKNSKSRPSGSSARSRSPSSSSTDRAYSSYNTICPRETPTWQKPITSFFQNSEKSKNGMTEELPKTTNTENSQNKIPDIDMEDVPVSNSNDVDVGQTTTNGEIDTEMEEGFGNIITKIRRRDEDDDIAPKKKRKLDVNVYAGLEVLEN